MSQLDAFFTSEETRPSRNKSSLARRIVGVAVVIFFIVLGIILFRALTADSGPTDYEGVGTGAVVVVVESGDSLTAIGQRLVDAGVVLTLDAFVQAAEMDERASRIGPGSYELREEMSGQSALELMLDPVSRASSRMVLPEGLRLDQTVDILVKSSGLPRADFDQVLQAPQELGLPRWAEDRPEGFMFPATYELTGTETAEGLLAALVKRFDVASVNADLESRADTAGRSPYDVLIVASLVEAEVAPADFAKAAAVVYNRLERDMPLQFDSTVSYALGINELQLSAEQIETDSLYNTYANKGLPPTPINSPGDAAIEAALNPAKGEWLYFVAVGPNSTETKFAKTYDRFLKLKQQFRENLQQAS
jgi:UPF0755 protein